MTMQMTTHSSSSITFLCFKKVISFKIIHKLIYFTLRMIGYFKEVVIERSHQIVQTLLECVGVYYSEL